LEAFQRLSERLSAPVLNDVPAGELHELGAEVIGKALAMFHRCEAIEFT
jgi:hypothetical protein